MTYPGTARVRQDITQVGRASVKMSLAIERTDEPGVAYATGRSVIVWYDYVAGRSVPWPESVRARFA
jgi:acyl-CoA thioester hydrolase